MSDIVERLRAWVYTDSLYATAREAADEIERLRLSARADFPEPENTAHQDNGKTLTREERDVLREVCRVYGDEDDTGCNEIAYVIDRLLERLGGAANSTPIHRKACGKSRTGSDDETAAEDAAKCTVPSKKCPERDRLVRSLESRLEEMRAAADKADAEYREEIARLRLTEEEREALEWGASFYSHHAATLRGLLARMSPPAT